MDSNAFYDVFCLAFLHVDHLWQSKNAIRSQFGQIINEIKQLLTRILHHSPRSMDEFYAIAQQEGVAMFH